MPADIALCQSCGLLADMRRWQVPQRLLCHHCFALAALRAFGLAMGRILNHWLATPAVQRLERWVEQVNKQAAEDMDDRRNNDTAVLRARQAHQLGDARRNRT
jgi:hypothetical protein